VRSLELSSPEYVITTVEEGRAAMALCQSRQFDCVVLEVNLPDVSGFEVLNTLCPFASQPDLAVVILTKLEFATLPSVAKTNGAQGYLIKSQSSAEQLDRAIRNAMTMIGTREHGILAPL